VRSTQRAAHNQDPLFILINDRHLNADVFGDESPGSTLIVLVAIQPAAGSPRASYKGAFVNRTDASVVRTGLHRTEGNSEPASGTQKFIGAGGNGKPKSLCRRCFGVYVIAPLGR
jgi:hypothetical protein